MSVSLESESIELTFVTDKPYFVRRVIKINKSNGNIQISDYDRVDNSHLRDMSMNVFDFDDYLIKHPNGDEL